MDVGLVLVFAAVFLVSYLFITSPKNLPPGPLVIPFLGSIGVVRSMQKKRPYLALYDLSKQYGPVFSLKLGNQRIVVLTGYDVLKEALVKQADVFSDRPTYNRTVKVFIRDGEGVLFSGYNHNWKVLRRFTLQALRDLGVGKSSLEEMIAVEIEATSKLYKVQEGQPIDIHASMQKFIGNIIFGIVFGRRYEYDDPEIDNIRLLTDAVFEGNGALSAANFLPEVLVKVLRLFSRQGSLNKTWQNTDRINQFIRSSIERHEATFDENNIRDFIDLHIKTSRDHEGEDDSAFTTGNLFRVINDLFIAGSETTASSLDWVLLYMAEYPDTQKKCQAEIEEVFGDKYIAYADRESLPYLNATLSEIQRLAAILPMAVAHSTMKDTTLHGFNIPAGTFVLPSLYSASVDPKYWTNPEIFNPDRFLDKTGKLLKPEALVQFSLGPRQCLGEPLARMELFLVFANLLQRFNFRRENEAVKHTMESRPFKITNLPLPYRLRIHSRM